MRLWKQWLGVVVVWLLAGALSLEAQIVELRARLETGSTLRYAIRATHQVSVDYEPRLARSAEYADINRKYEITGVLAIDVAEAGTDGSLRLEARFAELQLSEWFWGSDRAEAEEMVAALRQQHLTLRRTASGQLSLTGTARIPLERFRPDIERLEEVVRLLVPDLGVTGVVPGSRWRREIPPEQYSYHGQAMPGVTVTDYHYLGNRMVGGQTCALLAAESTLPPEALALLGKAEMTAALAAQGKNTRSSGEARQQVVQLVAIEPGLLLVAGDYTNAVYRLAVWEERPEPQVRLPLPWLTMHFAGERVVQWLGPGERALVAGVAALSALDELVGGGGSLQSEVRGRQGRSLGEIAREVRAQREQQVREVGRRRPVESRGTQETELLHIPVNSPISATSDQVRFDLRTSRDGNGAVVVTSREPQVVPLYDVGGLDIDNAQLVYQAWLRTEEVVGQAYLEMWCVFSGRDEFFSRGLAQAVTGTHDWVQVETVFLLERDQRPSRVRLNLVLNGRGRVWVDDIRLLRRPLP